MSAQQPEFESPQEFISRYSEGEDRYIRFGEEILDQELSRVQKQILRAVENNKRVLIISGNGVGKSHALSVLNLAYLYCNLEATVLATSGSYSQLSDTLFKPMSKMLREAKERYRFLPGRPVSNPSQQIKFDSREDQFFKCISTRNPGDLEGRHSKHIMTVVEEGDKPSVTEEVIDSANSSITDDRDRMVVVANPPKSESNSIVPLMNSDKWKVVQFSSFESRNVQVSAGELDKQKIPGMVDLSKIKDDWERWNDEPWPGYHDAKNSHDRDDLDTRWYRRRLGMMPPDDADAIRPFKVGHAEQAEERYEQAEAEGSLEHEYKAIGFDVARGGGDRSVICGVTDTHLEVIAAVEEPGHHHVNKELLRENVDDEDIPVVIDAVGEGSSLADDMADEYNVVRFNGGENAKQEEKYYDKRTEALGEIGSWLKGDGRIAPETELARETKAASRVIEYEEKRTRSSNTFSATSKDELKLSHNLGRSPDLLDAASLALWGKNLCATGFSDAAWGIVSEGDETEWDDNNDDPVWDDW